MGGRKYYAVRKGRAVGIFETWEECRACVEGYPDAEYKSFRERREAEEYLGDILDGASAGEDFAEGGGCEGTASRGMPRAEGCVDTDCNMPRAAGGPDSDCGMPRADGGGDSDCGKPMAAGGGDSDCGIQRAAGGPDVRRGLQFYKALPEERPEPGTLLAYVDGSYDDSLKKYAFGCVFILPDGHICTEFGNGEKEQALRHRNVSGEMLGAMYAVRTAMVSGFRRVELRYDYEGIEKWVMGKWRSKTELTAKYAKAMGEWGEKIDIRFTKVAAHSNVRYNELADRLAKRGLREGQGTPKIRRLKGESV